MKTNNTIKDIADNIDTISTYSVFEKRKYVTDINPLETHVVMLRVSAVTVASVANLEDVSRLNLDNTYVFEGRAGIVHTLPMTEVNKADGVFVATTDIYPLKLVAAVARLSLLDRVKGELLLRHLSEMDNDQATQTLLHVVGWV